MTYRIAHLVQRRVVPARSLGVTFTNKAAREMRERVAALLGKAPQGITLSTFHSLGVRILRAEAQGLALRPNFTILDSSDQVSLMREVLREIRGTVRWWLDPRGRRRAAPDPAWLDSASMPGARRRKGGVRAAPPSAKLRLWITTRLTAFRPMEGGAETTGACS